MENKNASPISQATGLMLSAMEKLMKKEITAAEASAVALNGKMIVEAAREATSFAKTTGFIPADSAFGPIHNFREIEPSVSEESLAAQRVRLDDGDAKILPSPKMSRKEARDAWHNVEGFD